jgi:hypothetical protein
MRHKRSWPSFETPRKRAAPRDDVECVAALRPGHETLAFLRKSAFPWKADFLRGRQFLAAFNLH